MKHVMMSSSWEFSTEPFPAYRVNLVYGRNKRDREFLAVAAGVAPDVIYTVIDNDGKEIYSGREKTTAEKTKTEYDAAHANVQGVWSIPRATIKATLPILPAGKFRVIKTKEKGTILVVPGEDTTNRCLLFVGCAGGFRGGVDVVKEGTTGQVLKYCLAGNNCESSCEVAVLLDVNQSVAFHTSGRRTNEVYVYTWDGTDVRSSHFSYEEWKNKDAVASVPDDAEVL